MHLLCVYRCICWLGGLQPTQCGQVVTLRSRPSQEMHCCKHTAASRASWLLPLALLGCCSTCCCCRCAQCPHRCVHWLLVALIAWHHHHHPVTARRQCNRQGTQHITQATCLAPWGNLPSSKASTAFSNWMLQEKHIQPFWSGS